MDIRSRAAHQRRLRDVVQARAAAAARTFGEWLAQQTGRRDPVGDLARDYTQPCQCDACQARTARRYSVAGVRRELDDHDADPDAYTALEVAAAEWRTATGREQP